MIGGMTVTMPSRLSGGALVRRDSERPAASPYGEKPFIRLFDPLDLYTSSGCLGLLLRAAVLVLQNPDTAFAEVAVREVEGNKYILLAPASADNPRREELGMRPDQGGALLRTADDVLLAGGVAAVPGVSYRMDAFLVEDEELGWVVAGNWTQAKRELRGSRSVAGDAAPAGGDEAAATKMEG